LSSQRKQAFRPRLEALEGRIVPSVSVLVRYASTPAVPPGAAVAPNLVPNLYKVEAPGNLPLKKFLDALKHNPNVLYAEQDATVSVATAPDDPQFGNQWGLNNTGQSSGIVDADIDAPEAWDVRTTGGGLKVAVIDTGIDYTHPDLAANIWTNPGEIPGNGIDDDGNGYIDDVHGYDFVNNDGDPLDDMGHGTHVAGTIAAVGNNGMGVTGVVWGDVKLVALKFLDANGSGSISDAIRAINYCVANGITISNNSWGSGIGFLALRDAIKSAGNAGHLFVAAAGNNSDDADISPSYPAAFDLNNIISVAATDRFSQLASFSNYGKTSVDIGAPGQDIVSTFPTYLTDWMVSRGFSTDYGTISGTSMATPHVTGAAVLVQAQHPTWTIQQVKDQLLSSVDFNQSLYNRTVTGGVLNIARALDGTPGAPPSGPPIVNVNEPGGADSITLYGRKPTLPGWVLLSNDLDPDRQPLTIVGIANASSELGVSFNKNTQKFTFSPTQIDPSGSFDYTIMDSEGNTATGHCIVTIFNGRLQAASNDRLQAASLAYDLAGLVLARPRTGARPRR
jgi:subtilisin family serine protease